jgi:1-deoxy-D-xylulose-5-phosphate synthase
MGPSTVSGLANMGREELAQLCSELRARMVATVLETGGHLSASLGAVELAVALHRVFDTARDRVVWDVGHQAYAHKLLTGREESFETLRQYGGLSGFPDPEESRHDAYVAGHAGNAISAALGLGVARDRSGGTHDVVAVVGDGSLTAGMSYEALNHAGQAGTRLIIVLNDNGMSISPTVGSLARRLHMLRTGAAYARFKRDTDHALFTLPLGRRVRWLLRRLKSGVKSMVTPVMLFEQLGITYLGPLDGHDVMSMERAFLRARTLSKPVVVHVVTQKGRGYSPAEADPVRYHGVAPCVEREVNCQTFSAVFADTMRELLAEDSHIVVVTAAMLDGTGLSAIAHEFPGRVIDVGISEQHAVTLAGGLAAGGMRPVVAIYSTFLQRAFDQIIHDICLPRLPVVFAVDRAGIVGEDGKTHQGIFDIAYLGMVPNMVVRAPRDGPRLAAMLRESLSSDGPAAIRYPRARVPESVSSVARGGAAVSPAEVLREGRQVLVVAVGSMVQPALEAADALLEAGMPVGVIDPGVVHPVDSRALCEAVSHYQAVVTVEEHVLSGGFGAAVAAALQDGGLAHVGVTRCGVPDVFVPHGPRERLLADLGLDAASLRRTVQSVWMDLVSGPRR